MQKKEDKKTTEDDEEERLLSAQDLVQINSGQILGSRWLNRDLILGFHISELNDTPAAALTTGRLPGARCSPDTPVAALTHWTPSRGALQPTEP